MLDKKIDVRLDDLKQTVALMKKKDRTAALKIVQSGFGNSLMDGLRNDIAAMQRAEQELLQKRSDESEASFRTTLLSILLPAIIGVVLAGAVSYLSQRSLRQRQRASLILGEQKERLRTTLASIGDGVISTDSTGNVTYLNAVAEELTGWTNCDAVGVPLTRVFHIVNESTRLPVENPATRALKEGVVVGLANHTVLIAKDGTERPIDDSAAPIRCVEGELVGCVLVFRDITMRKQAEERFREQAELHRVTLASIGDAVLTTDANGNVTYLNAVAQELTGWPLDEAHGMSLATVFKIINESTRQPVDVTVEKVLKLRAGCRAGRTTRSSSAGTVRSGRLKTAPAAPIRDATERIVGVILVFRDVTARKEREAVFAGERGVASVGPRRRRTRHVARGPGDWRVTRTDARFRAIFGTTDEVTDYLNLFAVIHPDDLPAVEAAMAAATRPQDPAYAIEYRVVHPDRSLHWVFAKGRVTFDADRPASFDGTLADITARKLIQDERERLVGQLREQDERKDEFLATLAHELRNPLAPIRNGLQVMKLANGNAKAIEQSRMMIERQLEQMVRLVDDLMDVSRISRGKLRLKFGRVQLAAVVSSSVETSRPLIDKMGHELTVILPKQPVVIEADFTRLAQVLLNLLNNAAKYSDRGGRILLTCEQQGSDVVMSVRDTGIGIAPDQLPHVFEMFSQVDRSLEKSQGGLGIGLAPCAAD